MRGMLLRDIWDFAPYLSEQDLYKAYKTYVTACLQINRTASSLLADMRQSDVSMETCNAALSLCRARCRLLCLSHLSGLKSKAKVQMCIFCNTVLLDGYGHVVFSCPAWQALRKSLLMHHVGDDAAALTLKSLMECSANSPMIHKVAKFWQEVDRAANSYWNEF